MLHICDIASQAAATAGAAGRTCPASSRQRDRCNRKYVAVQFIESGECFKRHILLGDIAAECTRQTDARQYSFAGVASIRLATTAAAAIPFASLAHGQFRAKSVQRRARQALQGMGIDTSATASPEMKKCRADAFLGALDEHAQLFVWGWNFMSVWHGFAWSSKSEIWGDCTGSFGRDTWRCRNCRNHGLVRSSEGYGQVPLVCKTGRAGDVRRAGHRVSAVGVRAQSQCIAATRPRFAAQRSDRHGQRFVVVDRVNRGNILELHYLHTYGTSRLTALRW